VKEHLTQERIEAVRSRLDHATPGTWGSGKVPGTIVAAAVTEKAVEESGVSQEILDKYGGSRWPATWARLTGSSSVRYGTMLGGCWRTGSA
jgi:hypothetical protein